MTDLITFCLQGVYWTFSCKWASLSQLAQHGSAVFASVQLAALLLMPSDPDSNVKKKNEGAVMRRGVRTGKTCLLGVGTLHCAVQRIQSSKAKF